MINAERIAEMKRLSAEATRCAWFITEGNFVDSEVSEDADYYLVTAHFRQDAQFIAESRQFVPDIIAAYEEQAVELRLTKIENERLQALADFEVKCTIAANQEIAKLRKALTDIYNADDELTLAEHSRLSLEIAGEALK